MPQMAPLNWLSLYIMFIMILWMFIINIFFFKISYIKSNNFIKNKNHINWKW